MADFDENNPDFLAFAVTARLRLEETFFALRGVADRTSSPTAENASALQRAGGEIQAIAQELCEKLDRVSTALLQGDIALHVDDLIAVVFEIGARSAEARSLGDERKKIQSDRAKTGVISRRKDEMAWKSHCESVIAKERSKNTDDLTAVILHTWPKTVKKRAYATVRAHVAGKLGNSPGRPRVKKKRAQNDKRARSNAI